MGMTRLITRPEIVLNDLQWCTAVHDEAEPWPAMPLHTLGGGGDA